MTIADRIDELEVEAGSAAFWGLGQVGIAIKGPAGALYVDPYLTDSDGTGGTLPRISPPPLTPHEVTNADAVLLTHDRVNHTDPEAVSCGSGSGRRPLVVPEAGKALSVAGPTIIAVPSAHTELGRDAERGCPYLGYVIELSGVNVYHAGDTVITTD